MKRARRRKHSAGGRGHVTASYSDTWPRRGRSISRRYGLFRSAAARRARRSRGGDASLRRGRSRGPQFTAVLDVERRIASGPVWLPPARVEADRLRPCDLRVSQGHLVVKDVSPRLGAGQTFAIVGPTGSGKSTLLRLLLRFTTWTTGQFWWTPRRAWSSTCGSAERIGLVAQEVRGGGPDPRQRALRAPRRSDSEVPRRWRGQCTGFVQRLPQG